jgi:hypothetical protein
MQLLLETCDKDRPSIRNNGLRYPMIMDIVRDLQLCILVDSVCGGHRYEVSGLSQMVHDNPYGLIPTRGAGQTNNEVHACIFPLPLGNAQRM